MNKVTIALAVTLAAALSGCGRNDGGTSTASSDAAAQASATPAASPMAGAEGGAAPMGSAESGAPVDTAALGAGPDAGKAVFDKTCQVCHATGVTGAPKLGDKADWKPRIAQGTATLYQHAIQGFTGKKGMMPPKGGNTALADADVKSAVDYMVAQGK